MCVQFSILGLRQFDWFLKPGDVNDNLLAVIVDIFSLSTAPRHSLILQETYVPGFEGNPSILHHYGMSLQLGSSRLSYHQVYQLLDHYHLISHRGFLSKLPSLSHLTINMNRSNFETKYLHELLSFSEPHPTLSSLEIRGLPTCKRRLEIDEAIRTSLPQLQSILFLLNVVIPMVGSRDQVEGLERLCKNGEQVAFDRLSESMPHCRTQRLLRPDYLFEFDEFDEGIAVEDWDAVI